MSIKTRLLIPIAAFVLGWALNWTVHRIYDQYHQPEPPIKVTIIDSGGAKLKVESHVVEEKKK